MTLKARNNFTLVFASLFLAICAAALAFYLARLNLMRRADFFSSYGISFKGLALFSENLWAVVFSEACMIFYIPAACFYLYARFEKTPSNEVAYFVLFLLGCLPELFRLFVPLEIAHENYPRLLVIVGRALFWGRTLSFVSLFAASLFASKDMRLNAEQNIFVLALFSLALASIVPVNTARISKAFSVQTGWPVFFCVLCGLAASLTVISYAIKAYDSENSACLNLGVDVLLIEAGLLLLNESAIPAVSFAGAALLIPGTFRYFSNLHKMYS